MSHMMPVPSSHGAMECGRVKLSDREISNMWCGKRNFGYICQVEGTLMSLSKSNKSEFGCLREAASLQIIKQMECRKKQAYCMKNRIKFKHLFQSDVLLLLSQHR